LTYATGIAFSQSGLFTVSSLHCPCPLVADVGEYAVFLITGSLLFAKYQPVALVITSQG